jgi:hypothetical protein
MIQVQFNIKQKQDHFVYYNLMIGKGCKKWGQLPLISLTRDYKDFNGDTFYGDWIWSFNGFNIKQLLINLLRNRKYNKPTTWQCFYNQWLHQGYLWNWYSYEFYSKHQLTLPMVNGKYVV